MNRDRFKLIVVVFAVIFSLTLLRAWFQLFHFVTWHRVSLRYFIFGFLSFVPVWYLWMKKADFFTTFEHEFTHLIVGLFFLKKPAGFAVTEGQGGVTQLYGSNFVISLAPYFLPTLALLFLPLYFVMSLKFYKEYFFILGLLSSYHVFSTIDEFSYQQSDIYKHGNVFSTIFIIFGNLLFYGYLFAIAVGGFKMGWYFLKWGFFYSFKWFFHHIF